MSMPNSRRQSLRRSPPSGASHSAESPEPMPHAAAHVPETPEGDTRLAPDPAASSDEPQDQEPVEQSLPLLRKTKRQTLSPNLASHEPAGPSPAISSVSGPLSPGARLVRSGSTGSSAAAAPALGLRPATFTVNENVNRPLLEGWMQEAKELAATLPDAQSVLYRKFLNTSAPSPSFGTLDEFTAFTEALQPLATELRGLAGVDAGKVNATLDRLSQGLVRLRKTGMTGPPKADAPEDAQSNEWWTAIDEITQAAAALKTASEATATVYRKLRDCSQVLSQIFNGTDEQVWLERDGQPVAVAGYRIGSQGVELADIATCPDYLRRGVSGTGGALMEYLARLAKSRNSGISLLALGDDVRKIYGNWGFVAVGKSGAMVLSGAALDKFLETHTVFASGR